MDSAALTPSPEVQDAPDGSLYVLGPAHSPGEVPFAVPDADGVVTLTPRRSTVVALASMRFGPSFLLLVFYAVIFGDMPYWMALGVVIAVPAACAAGRLLRLKIVVTAERVGLRGLFRTRWYDRSSLARLLIVRGYARRTHAFLFDADGKRVMRLYGDLWDEPRIRALHAALALPTRVRQGPTTRKDLRDEEPGALAWPEGHPVAFVTITLVGASIALAVLFSVAVNVGIMILVNSSLG